MIAQPLPTVMRRRGKRPPVAEVAGIAQEREAESIVVGLPLDEHGDESDWTAEVRSFGQKLADRVSLPLHFVDERMTSARAQRAIREAGLSRSQRERKDLVDATAAVIILQTHLDSLARANASNDS